jgi:hypothetical protein
LPVADLLKRTQVKAEDQKSVRSATPSFRAAVPLGQVLAQAAEGTKSLDHAGLADYIHSHTSRTVVGGIADAKDGERAKPRTPFTQFRERRRQRCRRVSQRHGAADAPAAAIQVRRHALSLCGREEGAVPSSRARVVRRDRGTTGRKE